jgi:hypothetical protein
LECGLLEVVWWPCGNIPVSYLVPEVAPWPVFERQAGLAGCSWKAPPRRRLGDLANYASGEVRL